ncbi:MAG: hypothetical protein J2P52_02180 [Blastocatellia bacterium]|nr:hypothetical protein [Blastocatellia bacterium]
MKRKLIPLIIILPLFTLFSSLEIYAQGGDPSLGGNKPAPAPAPTPKTTSARASRPTPSTPVITTLNVGEVRKGKLDPKNSGKNPDGSFFEEMIFNAKSEDWLNFHVEGDNPLLGLQILDHSGAEIAVARDPSGDFKIATPTGGLPSDGEYRVRVTGVLIGKSASPFTIKLDCLGLTVVAYVERFSKINSSYNDKDPASVQQTVAKLEELGRDNPSRSTAFELLSLIYLNPLNDIEKAAVAMEKAIKASGRALIEISFDSQWRRMEKLRSGNYAFEDARSGWLKIGPGYVTLTDAGNKTLATVNGIQIKELSKNLVDKHSMVTITADNARKPYIFAPKTMQSAEADLIINLIQNYVVGKAN